MKLTIIAIALCCIGGQAISSTPCMLFADDLVAILRARVDATISGSERPGPIDLRKSVRSDYLKEYVNGEADIDRDIFYHDVFFAISDVADEVAKMNEEQRSSAYSEILISQMKFCSDGFPNYR